MVSGNSWSLPHHTLPKGIPARKVSPHTIARAPSPPIRYKYKLGTDIQRNKRVGITHREEGNHHQRQPSLTERGISPTKRTSPVRNSFAPITTMTTTASGFVDDADGDEEHADDDMSLISMTNLIADDVCRLQNCRFENIGPDIRQFGNAKGKGTDFRTGQDKKKRNKTKRAKTSKSGKSNPPRLVSGYESTDTGSMTSGLSQSPTNHRASQIEVEVIDESDNISEITPTGCVTLEGRSSQRRGSNHRFNDHRKDLSPEESFREFLVSMTACLPSADMQRGCSDAQTTFPNYCERSPGCDGCINKGNDMHYNNIKGFRHGGNNCIPHSVASTPETPFFKNNSDRYNQLVNGREHSESRPKSGIDPQRRKYSPPSWFKSKKREVNKLRNNIKVVQPQEIPARQSNKSHRNNDTSVELVWNESKSLKAHKRILSSRGSVEALPTPPSKKMHSRTPILKKLLIRGKCKEGKGRQEKEEEEANTPVLADDRPVSITNNGPPISHRDNKQSPSNPCNDNHIQGVSNCVSSTVITPGNLVIDMCNSDITMGVVGATHVTVAAKEKNAIGIPHRSSARTVSPGGVVPKTKSRTTSIKPAKTTKTSISPPRKDSAPVWRGDEDPNFQPRWPNRKERQQAPPSLPRETRRPHKNLSRCYPRSSKPIDPGDDDSGPMMKWTKSRSYEEDDCRQEDIKVVSIIGHHFSSSELERHASNNFRRDGDIIINNRNNSNNNNNNNITPMISDRHQNLFAQKPERRKHNSKPRRDTGGKKYANRGSPRSNNSDSLASSSSDSSYESSSSSSRQRPSRAVPNSRHQSNTKAPRCFRGNETNAGFAVSNNFTSMYADEENSSSEAMGSPWRKDYEAHVSSKSKSAGNAKLQTSPRGVIMAPPKIRRSFDRNGNFDVHTHKRSPPQHRQMLV